MGEVSIYIDKNCSLETRIKRESQIVEWFSDVNINSKIGFDISDEGFELINIRGERLDSVAEVDVYKLFEDEIDLIARKLFITQEELYNMRNSILGEPEQYLLREYINRRRNWNVNTCIFSVNDIVVNNEEKDYIVIKIYVSTKDKKVDETFEKIKNRCADKMTELFLMEIKPAYLPNCNIYLIDRLNDLLFRMLFELKAYCEYEELSWRDAIGMHIIKNKYDNNKQNGRLVDPNEITEPLDIDQIREKPFRPLSFGEMTMLMGLYSCDEYSYEGSKIGICESVIRFVIDKLAMEKDFRDKFVNAYFNIHCGSEDEILRMVSSKMKQKVIHHELGHMVFRRIREKISESENETFANWFSSIMGDDYCYELSKYLFPLQPKKYHGFIELIKDYGLTRDEIKDYEQKLLNIWELIEV